MKKITLTILLCLPLWSQLLFAQQKEWVKLGQHDFTEGYKTLYRLSLEVPKGIHDAYDIKKGLQVMRFKLNWLPPFTNQTDIQNYFKKLLAAEFESPEDLKFNQRILNSLYNKLPEAKRHDEWVFEYSPDAGTKLYIDNIKIHSMIGSEINNALHEAWLHKSPLITAKLMSRLLKANTATSATTPRLHK